MSNRPNTRRRRRRSPSRSQRGPDRRALVLGGGLLVAVLAAVAVAIGVGGGGDDPLEVSDRIEVTGEPLGEPPESGAADPEVGQPAPALSGTGIDGEPLTVEPGGRPTALVFAAHWCPACQAEVPRIAGPLAERRDEIDVVLVSTGVDRLRPNHPPSDWLEEEGWSAPVLMDDEESSAAVAYGLRNYPYFVLLDGEGRVVERRSGEQDTGDLLASVDALAGR